MIMLFRMNFPFLKYLKISIVSLVLIISPTDQAIAQCYDLNGTGLECDSAKLQVAVTGLGLTYANGVLSIEGLSSFNLAGTEKGSLIGGDGLNWNGTHLDIDGPGLAGSGFSWGSSNWNLDGNATGSQLTWINDKLTPDFGAAGVFQGMDHETIHFTAANPSSTQITIGRSSPVPGQMLTVGGGMISVGLMVDDVSDGWPDYVFEEDYPLRSLTDLEDYLKTEKHLPGIPSATKIKEEGLDLGRMNVLLLKKIEELTLYVLEREESLKKQNNTIAKLKSQQREMLEIFNKRVN